MNLWRLMRGHESAFRAMTPAWSKIVNNFLKDLFLHYAEGAALGVILIGVVVLIQRIRGYLRRRKTKEDRR